MLMDTRIKKTLSVLLAALMLISAVPAVSELLPAAIGELISGMVPAVVFANAADADFEWETNADGTLTLKRYNGTDAYVSIPSTVNGKRVTAIGPGAFENNGTLNVVKIPCVTDIGNAAFRNCKELVYVYYNADRYYSGCKTSNNAFNGCNNPFFECTGSHHYVNWLTAQLQITDELSDYEKTKRVFDYVLKHFDYAYEVFSGSKSLLWYDLAGAVMGSSKLVCGGFALVMREVLRGIGVDCVLAEGRCTGTPHSWNIVSIDGYWYHLDVSGAGYLRWYPFLVNDAEMRTYCTEFEGYYPKADYNYGSAPALKRSGDYWYEETSANTVTIRHCRMDAQDPAVPEKLNGKTVTRIGQDAFAYYQNTTISLPQTLQRIDNGAFRSSKFFDITIPARVSEIGEDAFSRARVSRIDARSSALQTIAPNTFRGCFFLESVTLPAGIETICTEAFSINNSLNLKLLGKQTVIEENAFQRMYNNDLLIRIYHVPGANAIGYTQANAQISFYEFGDRLLYFALGAFPARIDQDTCEVLLSLPYGTQPETLQASYTASELASVDFPANPDYSSPVSLTVTSLDGRHRTYTVRTEIAAFPDPITKDTYTIDKYNCLYPEKEAVEADYDPYFYSIPHEAYYGGGPWMENSARVNTMVLPENTERIGEYAFAGLKDLTTFTIPASVKSIGDHAFYPTAYYSDSSHWENNILYADGCALDISEQANGQNLVIKDGTRLLFDNGYDCLIGRSAVRSPDSISLPASIAYVGKDFAFAYADLESIEVDPANPYYSSADGVLYNKDGSELIKFPENKSLLAAVAPGTKRIARNALHGSRIRSVWIPKTVREISPYACGSYFVNSGMCVLYEGTEEEWNAVSGTEAFRNAAVLFEQPGSDLPAARVTSAAVYVNNGRMICATQAKEVYYYGTGEITNFYLGNMDLSSEDVIALHLGEGITSISDRVFHLTSLESLYLPRTLQSIRYSNFDSVKLKYVVLNNADIYLDGQDSGRIQVFGQSTIPKTIVIGPDAKTINWKIVSALSPVFFYVVDEENPVYKDEDGVLLSKDGKMLYHYPRLNHPVYRIPDGVETVDYEAFSPNNGIEELTITVSVKLIGHSAFNSMYCRFYYDGNAHDWAAVTVEYDNDVITKSPPTFLRQVPPNAHVYTLASQTQPSCTEAGSKEYRCTVCGEAKTEAVSALGHDYVNHEAKTAACNEKGWKAYQTCSRCDYTSYEEIPALGHDCVNHEAKAATCTEKGWKAYQTCSRCDYTSYKEIPASGHAWGNWTKLDENRHQRVCANDSSHTEKADHTWDPGKVTKPATAAEAGEKTFTCTVCGSKRTEIIPKLDDTVIHTETVRENGTVVLAAPDLTAADIISAAGTGAQVLSKGITLEPSDKVGTGMILQKVGGAQRTVIIIGDVNGDGGVTAADARLALRKAVDLETYAEDSPEYIACNVDRDHSVTAADARIILRAAVSLEDPKAWSGE